MWRSVKVLWRGWLIFFSRTGSFTDIGRKFLFRTFHRWLFSHKLSMCMTLDTLNEQACQNLYHPGCSVGLFNLNILVFFKPPVLSEVLVGIHSLHWETMFGIRQNPIHFFFHVPHRWFRNEEMRSAAEGRLKEYNKLTMHTKWLTQMLTIIFAVQELGNNIIFRIDKIKEEQRCRLVFFYS